MTTQLDYQEHLGLVIDSNGGHLKISLIGSGCTGCHDSLCILGSSKAKEIDLVSTQHYFHSGDKVLVKVNRAAGYKAVMLLYVLPFALMMLALFLISTLGYGEEIAGLISISILLPYFFIVYLFRKQLKKHCKFEVVRQ